MNSERRAAGRDPRRTSLRAGLVLASIAAAAIALVWFESYRIPSPGPALQPESAGPASRETKSAQLREAGAGASTAPSLWRVVDEGSVPNHPPVGDGWSAAGRVLVDVTAATAAAHGWRPGDRVAVDVPQLGVRYEAEIDRIEDGPGRTRAARGMTVDADGHERRVVVTVGPGRVFAYVDTPRGPYELVGDGRLGWLLPTSSMMAGVDFSRPDYFVSHGERRGADRGDGTDRGIGADGAR